MWVQELLDDILRTQPLRTVKDLQFIPEDNVILVRRKFGARSTLIDVSKDQDEDSLRRHLNRVSAIY